MRITRLDSMMLAINGGSPIRETLLPYGRQSIDEDDICAVVDVLRSDWITTGPTVNEFEEMLSAYVGAAYAVTFASGTAALHAAAFAAGLGQGDEAITTPMTFCATANCVLYQNAKPVFADVNPDTLNIDLDEVARRITPCTKAVVPVDYAGHPAELDGVLELAERHGLVVIEDACHALGAKYKNRRVGSISHMTVFSFHPVKHITTGEGGMVVTDNPEYARRMRMFRSHGIERNLQGSEINGKWYYEMTALGFNCRLTDIGCALGLSQLKKLTANLARRQAIAGRYTEALREIPGITLPIVRPSVTHAWHLYPIHLNLDRLSVGRGEVFSALQAENIGVQVHYIPVHLHPYYQKRFGFRGGEYPVAEEAYERLISLPIFFGMSDRDVEDAISAVGKVLTYYAR